MAKKLTSSKAKEILHDKSVHGHPLTDKQRRFFGAIAGGAPIKAKSGGWLDSYQEGGVESRQAGYTDIPFNYNSAWGGQFAMGGSIPGSVGFTYARTQGAAPSNGPYAKKTKASAQDGLTFLEPNSPKLPMVGNHSEVAMSIGGEDGEPAFLVPSFKHGEFLLGPVENPVSEFRRTGEHLGGPFKTWKEADEWERNIRHPYVEKGQSIPTPLRRWGKDFENGGSMSYYQHGLDWKPRTISENGSNIPKAQNGKDQERKEALKKIIEENKRIKNQISAGYRNAAMPVNAADNTRNVALQQSINAQNAEIEGRKRATAKLRDDLNAVETLTGSGKRYSYEDAQKIQQQRAQQARIQEGIRTGEIASVGPTPRPLTEFEQTLGNIAPGGMPVARATAPITAATLLSGYGVGAIGETLPMVSSALGAPLTSMGAEYGTGALTANNLIGAGFFYKGAKNLPNVTDKWGTVIDNPTLENIGSAVGETAITALDMLPFLHGASKGIPSLMQDINQAGKYLTTQTPLRNTYKLNPWRFKPNPEAYYRMIGETGFDDAMSSGLIRSKKMNAYPEPYFGKGKIPDGEYSNPKSTAFNPQTGERIPTRGYPGPYMVESKVPMKGVGAFADDIDPLIATPSETVNAFDPRFKFYKQDWRRGYKEVPIDITKPIDGASTSVRSSANPFYKPSQLTNPSATNQENANLIDEILNERRAAWRTPEGQRRIALEIQNNPNANKLTHQDYLNVIDNARNLNAEIIQNQNTIRSSQNELKNLSEQYRLGKISKEEFLKNSNFFNDQIAGSTGELEIANKLRDSGSASLTMYDKEGLLDIGEGFTAADVPYIARHETGHAGGIINDDIVMIDPNAKNKIELLPTHLDKKLEGLELLEKEQLPDPNAKTIIPLNLEGYNAYDLFGGDKHYFNEAKKYWQRGSRGGEKVPFAEEVRSDLLEKGIIKNIYDPITEDMLVQHYDAYKQVPHGFKYPLRLYDIMKNTPKNVNLLKDVMNNMKGVVAPVIGAGAVGAGAMSAGEEQPAQQKKGGVIKDNRGQWAHPGKITEIGSNRITMQGVPYPVLGVSDTGHTQMMYPGEEYKFKGSKVTEFPLTKKVNQKSTGGWLDGYK